MVRVAGMEPKIRLKQKHAVAIAEKAISLPDCVGVSV
jgi:hypothetical protein